MADYSSMSQETARELEIRRILRGVHTVKPCIVTGFDAGSPQKVSVQPTEPVKVTLGEQVSYKAAPVLHNVPVVLPYAQTAGFVLTLPIQAGDTGLLLIADKSIDAFLNTGQPGTPIVEGEQPFSRPRGKSLSDAIFIPGLTTFTQGLPSYQTNAIEMRNKSRSVYISLSDSGIEMTDGQAVVKISGGNVAVIAPGTVTTEAQGEVTTTAQGAVNISTPSTCQISSSNMDLKGSGNRISGNITQENGTFTDGNGINSSSHTHGGVQSGDSSTGAAQ